VGQRGPEVEQLDETKELRCHSGMKNCDNETVLNEINTKKIGPLKRFGLRPVPNVFKAFYVSI